MSIHDGRDGGGEGERKEQRTKERQNNQVMSKTCKTIKINVIVSINQDGIQKRADGGHEMNTLRCHL